MVVSNNLFMYHSLLHLLTWAGFSQGKNKKGKKTLKFITKNFKRLDSPPDHSCKS